MKLHDDSAKMFSREPSYGSTAARYNALAKLGERVMEIFRDLDGSAPTPQERANARGAACARILLVARDLGLLKERDL